jgi:penicillin-binding protein 1A
MDALRLPPFEQTSVLLTADGHVYSPVFEQDRLVVPLSSVSTSVARAVVAVEDRRFFSHRGVDLRGVARALVVNLRAGRVIQGGSTLTQQLARAAVLRRADRTIRRKLAEAVVAVLLERELTKRQILEAYLNSAYFGHSTYGIELAALRHFGKSAATLDEREGAYLAGLLRAPARYCRCCDRTSAEQRTDLVLRLMRAVGRSSARGPWRQRPVSTDRLPLTGRYLSQYARSWLKSNLPGLYPKTQLVVHTTIDPHCQLAVERACSLVRRSGFDGRIACVVQDAGSGDIRGLSGGFDFRRHQFNAAISGNLQPGSVLKPFILLAALHAGLTLDQRYESKPLQVELPNRMIWTVRNAGGRYLGAITVADALVLSDNTVYAQLLLDTGIERVQRLLATVGMAGRVLTPALSTGAIRPGLSPLEVSSAYSAFSASGLFFKPSLISRIVAESKTVWEHRVPPVRACTDELSRLVTTVLQRVSSHGTGLLPDPISGLAAKTGTSISGGWYVSYDESYRVLTWTEADFLPVGVRRYSEKGVSAKLLANRIWQLLRGRRRGLSELFGAFSGVNEMSVRDLLWVDEQFR